MKHDEECPRPSSEFPCCPDQMCPCDREELEATMLAFEKLEEELDAAWMAVDLVKKENTQFGDALRKVQALTFSFVMNKDNAADILLIVKPIRDVIKQTLERNKL